MQRNQITHYTTLDSVIGILLIAGNSYGISLIKFKGEYEIHELDSNWKHSKTYFSETVTQLQQYFKGELKQFSVPTHFSGTKFQIAVISTLQSIPYGATCSYADLAKTIGHPKAYRAVGSANGMNPLPIIYPCHRILRKNGSLGNYGGGSFLPPIHPDNLQRKAYLINHEARQLNQSRNCLRFN